MIRRLFRIVPALTLIAACLLLITGGPASADNVVPTMRGYSTNSATGVTSISVNLPANVQAGDLLVASVGSGRSGDPADNVTPPSGWSTKYALHDTNTIGSHVYDAHIFYKVATGAEPASYTFTQDVSNYMSIVLDAFVDIDQATPFEDSAFVQDVAATTSHTTGTVTVSGTNRLLVAVLIDELSTGVTVPPEYANAGSASVSSWTGTHVRTTVAGPGSFNTTFTSGSTRHFTAFMLALKPTTFTPTFGVPYLRSSSSGSVVNTYSLNVPSPSGVQAGDVLVAAVMSSHSSKTVTITPTGGWSQLLSYHDPAWSDYDVLVLYKVSSGSEPANYTFTQDIDETLAVAISAYDNVDTSSPIEGSTYTTNSGTGPYNTGALTVGGPNRMLLGILMDFGAKSASGPAGYSLHAGAASSTNWSSSFIFGARKGAGTYNETLQASGTGNGDVAMLLALRPESSANSVTLSDARPSAVSSYTLTSTSVPLSAIKCIRIEFDHNVSGSGGKPTGMDISSVSFNTSSTYVPTPASWTKTIDAPNGVIKLTNASGETPASTSGALILDSITNPSPEETNFLLFSTYNDAACSSPMVTSGTYTFTTTNATVVNVSVDPSFTFSVAGRATACNAQSPSSFVSASSSAVALGRINAGVTAGGAQDLTTSSNATNGFTVYLRGLTGSNAMRGINSASIADVSGTHAAPGSAPSAGSEGFGYTLSDPSVGFASNSFAKLTTANEIAVTSNTVGSKSACVGYQVAIATTTPAGNYATTVVYTAVPAY